MKKRSVCLVPGQVRFEQVGQYIDILGQVRFDCIRPTKNIILRICFNKQCSVPGLVRFEQEGKYIDILGQVRLGQVRVNCICPTKNIISQISFSEHCSVLGQVRFEQEGQYIDIKDQEGLIAYAPPKIYNFMDKFQQTLLGAWLGQV